MQYINKIMPAEVQPPITDAEIVINYSPGYLADATNLTYEAPKRYEFQSLYQPHPYCLFVCFVYFFFTVL